MNVRTLKVDTLARVEGEGALLLKIKDGKVTDAKFRIYEPPRFFEAFLKGRAATEAPDITARICGICPVAYQMSSVHAIEAAWGMEISRPIRELRRLLYCGEWIESHALHIFMLQAPDFLGYDDAIQMAKDHPKEVEMALRLKKAGNTLMTVIGGREIHPINVRVGGFYKAPPARELKALKGELEWARDAAVQTARFCATLDYPEFERDYEFVALSHPDEYALCEGRLVSNRGLDIAVSEYEEHFAEEHVAHSTSLHSVHKGRGAYFVGPLARFNLNYDRLTPLAKAEAKAAGIEPGCRNPFKGVLARAAETIWACEEALRIIETYVEPDPPAVPAVPVPGTGHGCSEAPRGLLYHRYRVDDHGLIQEARIVPPTAQNQKTVEGDLWEFVPSRLDMPDDKLTLACEHVIRNYDPCISCSTHFLKLEITRE